MAFFLNYVILIRLALVTGFLLMLWEIQQFGGYTKTHVRLPNCAAQDSWLKSSVFQWGSLRLTQGSVQLEEKAVSHDVLISIFFSLKSDQMWGFIYRLQWSKIPFRHPLVFCSYLKDFYLWWKMVLVLSTLLFVSLHQFFSVKSVRCS